MNVPPEVRLAASDEVDVVAQVLTEAFVDEAGLNCWLKQGASKERARARFFAAAVRDAVHPGRRLWLAKTGGAKSGAAIWLAPGQQAFGLTPWRQVMVAPLLFSIAGVSGAMRGVEVAERLEQHHPHEPHAHLVFLGVAPAAQGKGVGSEMLKRTLAPLDATAVPAYLEATSERNVELYRRHGFEVTGEVDAAGVRFWCMTRLPRR